MDLLGLDRRRLRRVLDMLRLDVLWLDVLLLDVLLGRRSLLGLLGEVLRVLLLLLLLRVLLDVLLMLDVLGHVLLLLSSVLRHGDGRLDRGRVMLLLLVMLGLGLCLGLGLSLSLGGLGVWLGSICPVVHGLVATVHVGLGILVLGAVSPGRRVSKGRLLLRLHGHRLLGLGRP